MSSSFYVTLPSNTKERGNLTGDYVCNLPDPISLSGDWQVGLAEITYANSWDTLSSAYITLHTFNYSDITKSENEARPHGSYVPIPDGHYGTIESLIKAIHVAIEKFWNDEIALLQSFIGEDADRKAKHAPYIRKMRKARKDSVQLGYDKVRRRVHIKLSPEYVYRVYLTDPLKNALGIEHAIEQSSVMAEYPPNMLGSISTMFVYCDIISPQIVGDVKAPLIRTISVSGVYGAVTTVDFPNIHYVDLLTRNFQSIRITIKSEAGYTIPFKYGKTIVKLHFRRKRLQ
jgi:hypothetical protein